MRVCVTGDFHGYPPPEIPECDLLLFAGDLGRGERFYEGTGWTTATDYGDWLASLPMPVVGVAGNHDFDSETFKDLPWHYLENESIVIYPPFTPNEEVKVWGSPLSPSFGAWAHMRPDEDLARTWETIPEDVEIILVHGPPFGFCDFAQRQVHAGSRTLANRIAYGNFPNLKLITCGHIHEAYGIDHITMELEQGPLVIPVVNGSYVDERYRPGNAPIVVEL